MGSHTVPGQHSQPTPKSSRYVRLGVTCHPHFWQNDRGLLCAITVTRGGGGVERTPIRVSAESSTLKKKISPAAPAETRTLNLSFRSRTAKLSRFPMQKIKFPPLRVQIYKRFPSAKRGLGQNIAWHTSPLTYYFLTSRLFQLFLFVLFLKSSSNIEM